MSKGFTVVMKKRTAACLAVMILLAAMVATPAGAQNRVLVNIQNASRYDIHKIYLSLSRDQGWERDLLGNSILRSGRSFDIAATEGYYDLKLVDEDGDTCVVNHVSVFSNKAWTLTDSWLLGCEFH